MTKPLAKKRFPPWKAILGLAIVGLVGATAHSLSHKNIADAIKSETTVERIERKQSQKIADETKFNERAELLKTTIMSIEKSRLDPKIITPHIVHIMRNFYFTKNYKPITSLVQKILYSAGKQIKEIKEWKEKESYDVDDDTENTATRNVYRDKIKQLTIINDALKNGKIDWNNNLFFLIRIVEYKYSAKILEDYFSIMQNPEFKINTWKTMLTRVPNECIPFTLRELKQFLSEIDIENMNPKFKNKITNLIEDAVVNIVTYNIPEFFRHLKTAILSNNTELLSIIEFGIARKTFSDDFVRAYYLNPELVNRIIESAPDLIDIIVKSNITDFGYELGTLAVTMSHKDDDSVMHQAIRLNFFLTQNYIKSLKNSEISDSDIKKMIMILNDNLKDSKKVLSSDIIAFFDNALSLINEGNTGNELYKKLYSHKVY